MGRPRRVAAGGLVYHVLNRANGRARIFEDEADYQAFIKVLAQAVERCGIRLLAYCVMPNHWHLVVWPRHAGELSRFVGWLTLTHTQRWHAHRRSAGAGHVYQGRFKSFPVQSDAHLLTVCRYVERNALRANLVRKAEAWRWCSLWQVERGADASDRPMLSKWPIARPANWRERVNRPMNARETEALNRCMQRGQPYGDATWTQRTATRLHLQSTLRPRGRPKRATPAPKHAN